MKPIRHAVLLLAPLAITACSSKPADQDAGAGKEQPESQVTAAPSPAAAPSEAATTPAEVAGEIPSVLQGRWGLVAADCTSTRGDAKGLLLIAPTKLTFYESVGKLGTVKERTDSRIRASFSFTGEGMEWNREMVLESQNGGKALVRQEFGADAMPGPLKYARCP
jgi:hypothetical protein